LRENDWLQTRAEVQNYSQQNAKRKEHDAIYQQGLLHNTYAFRSDPL